MGRVRFAARDPGAANVLAAVLRCRGFQGGLDLDVWALPRAEQILRREGIVCRTFPGDATPDSLARAWRESPGRVLVTGTSHYAPFEAVLWRLARADGGASIALLDHWSNLAARFQHGRPDFVGAIDEAQAEELRALGFPPAALLVVGHPWLKHLRGRGAAIRPAGPLTPDARAVRVLFVSERLAGDVADGVNAPFGFDEHDAFQVVYDAGLDAARRGTTVHLAVKLHPYEDRDSFRAQLDRLARPPGLVARIVDASDDPHAWVMWADLVVGMTSSLLLEAMVLDRPVVSVQPGLRREDAFVPSSRGHARTLTDPREAQATLARLMESAQARAETMERHRGFVRAATGRPRASVGGWVAAQMSAQEAAHGNRSPH